MMRRTAFLALWCALLFVELPEVSGRARQPDDDDDAMQIANAVSGGDDAGVPAPPAGPVQAATASPAKPATVSMPGKVGLPTALQSFGQHEKPAVASFPQFIWEQGRAQ